MQFVDFYIVPGLVVGCIYAIAASGLVMTYSTSGVLNIGYGAVAYTTALIFYEIRSLHHFAGGWVSLALCGLLIGPLLGVGLWQLLFRWLVRLGVVVTLVASIGLTIALPALCELVFRPGDIFRAPGVALSGLTVHKIGNVAVSVDQMYAVGAALVVAGGLTVLLRFTFVGLKMRAVFDQRATASLIAISPAAMSNLSWAIGGGLAAVGGIFLAPVLGLTPGVFLTLTVASLAAALVGGLRSIAAAFVAALVLGVASTAITGASAHSVLLASGVEPSLPFVVMVGVVLLRRSRIDVGGASLGIGEAAERLTGPIPVLAKGAAALVAVAVVPLVLNGYWTGVVGQGLIFGIIFLGLMVGFGFGGMLSLGQAAFAGIAGYFAAQLATSGGVPLLVAILLGGMLVAAIAAVIAAIGGRLNVLEFGLLTLGFGLFADNFLYNWTALIPIEGASFNSPSLFGAILSSTKQQYYLFAGVLGLALIVVAACRRRIAAFYVNATRMDPRLAEATGVRSRTSRVSAFALAAFLSGVGGGLLGVDEKTISPADVSTATGLVWLAVVSFMGIRSPVGAVIGGLMYALVPAFFSNWLPVSWGPLVTVLFAVGALTLALNPRGVVAAQVDQLTWLRMRARSFRSERVPT